MIFYTAPVSNNNNNKDILYNAGIRHVVALMALSRYLFIRHIKRHTNVFLTSRFEGASFATSYEFVVMSLSSGVAYLQHER